MSGPVLGLPGLRAWACVGDVLDPSKPAHRVASSIESQGRMLYRVSPTLDAEDASPGKRLYKRFADVPHPEAEIDAVNLCCNYRIGMTVLEEMKRRGVQYCFFQPGADRDEAVRKAEELGITYQRGCMIHDRLAELSAEERASLEEKRGGAGAVDASGPSGCACGIL